MSINLLTSTKKGDQMLNYNELREKLKDRNLAYVARKTGVSYDFLVRLSHDKLKRLPLEPFQKLNVYFEEHK